jgi:hypothetical protein
LDTTGFPVLPRNFRTPSLFSGTNKNFPPAKCIPAANRV